MVWVVSKRFLFPCRVHRLLHEPRTWSAVGYEHAIPSAIGLQQRNSCCHTTFIGPPCHVSPIYVPAPHMSSSSPTALSAPRTCASTESGAWLLSAFDKIYPYPLEKRPWPACGRSTTASDHYLTPTLFASTACGERR